MIARLALALERFLVWLARCLGRYRKRHCPPRLLTDEEILAIVERELQMPFTTVMTAPTLTAWAERVRPDPPSLEPRRNLREYD